MPDEFPGSSFHGAAARGSGCGVAMGDNVNYYITIEFSLNELQYNTSAERQRTETIPAIAAATATAAELAEFARN